MPRMTWWQFEPDRKSPSAPVSADEWRIPLGVVLWELGALSLVAGIGGLLLGALAFSGSAIALAVLALLLAWAVFPKRGH